MKLEDIGFYTLTDARATQQAPADTVHRCEILLTGRCNFKCPYCRHVGGLDQPVERVEQQLRWLKPLNVRFSGGEPTLYPHLLRVVEYARSQGSQRVALSTNGSADFKLYRQLLRAGVNDFSISLDACCASEGAMMAGKQGEWENVCQNIKDLSTLTYVTVGIVLTPLDGATAAHTIELAHQLGVADIRVIPAAQAGVRLPELTIAPEIEAAHPILHYRLERLRQGLPVRGVGLTDCHTCPLVLDDLAIMGNQHYPCIIYMREGGEAIGEVNEDTLLARAMWHDMHVPQGDPICRNNCLDVCVAYNNRVRELGRW